MSDDSLFRNNCYLLRPINKEIFVFKNGFSDKELKPFFLFLSKMFRNSYIFFLFDGSGDSWYIFTTVHPIIRIQKQGGIAVDATDYGGTFR